MITKDQNLTNPTLAAAATASPATTTATEQPRGDHYQRTAPDAPAIDEEKVPRTTPLKLLKRVVKRRLFWLSQWLIDVSIWLQRRILYTTLERKRAETNLAIPLDAMDQDLLGMYIRWNGHHVEKTVRYERTIGRGSGKPILLRNALDEWNRRGYPHRRWIGWAEENLEDYKRWEETGRPQLHAANKLPAFNPQSPVMEVLKNRVSTRYWDEIPVEDEKIQAILEAGVYAPTSCNRQTWKIYVRKNPKIANVSNVSNKALREKAPVAMYITVDNRLYPEVWAPAEDAGIIGLQLNLAATALGLAGCLMYGSENFNQAEFRREYNVPSYRYMYLMFLFGYAAERTLTDKRIHADEVAIFI
jgi:nitroreductase